MSTRLDRVDDWIAVAMSCEFRLGKMAKAFDVSERTLRRHFHGRFGLTAKEWRDTRRLEITLAGLCRCERVKSTSNDAKFKHRESL
jgi:AraC-like DNA-binding protein